MMAGGKIRIAAHVEVEWPAAETADIRCPNCGTVGPVRQLLDIDYRPPGAAHHFILQVCPHCTARFADNPETMDYATEELIEIGWHTYQIQLGAGVWPITAPLTRIDKPAGARLLEIGGAYGFGLDFGIRGRGWAGVGFDPSPLAAFGARELGLDVAQAYFGEADLIAGGYDVVLATEVVEHLADPPAFFRLMARAVAAEGVLLLTTPDAAWITPDLPAAALMPLLSPGAHLVLQTEASLALALRAAGFAEVRVRREAMSLVAYASPAPFALRDDAAAGRALYRRYLVERAGLAAAESDLRLGFAGRGLFEAANDGDAAAADAAWAMLLPAVRERFGLDLESLTALPAAAAGASLAELGRVMPLGLGMILFGRAMQLLAADAPRERLLPLFRLAIAAIDALQAALARRSLGDGLSAALRQVAEVEVLICLAEAGDAAAVPALVALPAQGPGQIIAGWRGLVGLVNAGAFTAAETLQLALQLDDPAALPGNLRRDALMSLANLALAPDGKTERAFTAAAALEALGEPADDIVLQAFTRLVNAGQYEEALAALPARQITERTARAAGRESGHDARLARMVLDLAVGDPAEIPLRLEGLTLEPARREALLLEAFIRLVNASRYDEALAFRAAHDVPALAARAEGAVRQDSQGALLVLDLAAGDPAAVPGRLAAMTLAPGRREALLLEAFVRLVNASRYEAAAAYAAAHEVAALAVRNGAEPGRNAVIALAVAELAAGDPGAVPARLALLSVAPERAAALLFGAFTGLVNAGRHEAAQALADDHGLMPALETAVGPAAEDARIAAVLLAFELGQTEQAITRIMALRARPADPAVLDALHVDGFVRLLNEGKFVQARRLNEQAAMEPLLASCKPELRQDALAALLLLELQPGGAPARIPALLEAAAQGGLPESRVTGLAFAAFVTLVNGTEFRLARRLLPIIDPALLAMRPPFDEPARNALFAAGILALQERDDWRRSAALFARLRDALVKLTPPGDGGSAPDPLFWPALRGELLALHRLDRGADAEALLKTFLPAYAGAPDDLRDQAA